MPEPDDELDVLRSVDPVDPALLPSSTDPKAQALFERIAMTDGATKVIQPEARSKSKRRPLILMVGAAALAVVAAVAFGMTRNSNSDKPAGQDTANGPITPGGPSAGSCVEVYDLTTLTHREVAFDGTVESVEDDNVTFSINHWYRGGAGAEVALKGASSFGGLTPDGPATSLEVGTRLLVAGDGGFAWSCGFTRPYDPSVAEQWDNALTG